MILTIAYHFALVAVFVYLAIFGGRTGRWGGSLQLLTSLSSLAVATVFFQQPIIYVLMPAIDLASFVWKFLLAAFSNRSWPIWAAAFQMNVVAAALAAHLIQSWAVTLYYVMGTVWAVPTLLVMLVGTMQDRRFASRAGLPS